MPRTRESALPPSWQTAPAQRAWWARVATGSHSVLILDYDGTLAPFHVDRLAALPYPGVPERFARLLTLPRVTVVLVTGRSWLELKNLYPPAQQVEVWASHGREHSSATAEYHFIALTEEQKTILRSVMTDLQAAALPPSAIERKPASIAIHWRGLERDEQELLRKRVLKRFQGPTSSGAVELLPFEDGVELRATGRTKGDAVREIRARYGPEVPIAYLGDDHTDEEAFGAMGIEDLALLVRPAPRATLADYWMVAPEGVLEFLDGWIKACEDGPAADSPAPPSEGLTIEASGPTPDADSMLNPFLRRVGDVQD